MDCVCHCHSGSSPWTSLVPAASGHLSPEEVPPVCGHTSKEGVLLLAEGKCCYPHCLHCLLQAMAMALSAVEALQGLQCALPAHPTLMLCPGTDAVLYPALVQCRASLSPTGAVLFPALSRPEAPLGWGLPSVPSALSRPPFRLPARPAGGAHPAPSGAFRRGLAGRDDVTSVRQGGAAWSWRCSASTGTAAPLLLLLRACSQSRGLALALALALTLTRALP